MPTTDWLLADYLGMVHPHTFHAMQELVMAMADYQRNRGKKTLFGRDRGLASYEKFEDALRDTLLAMVRDEILQHHSTPEECREQLVDEISAFATAFPNWQDAYAFAQEYFIDRSDIAEGWIQACMRGSINTEMPMATHMTARDRALSLANSVNDILCRYVAVHNDVFDSSLRRMIPIPGLFQAVQYCTHRDTLAGLQSELVVVAEQAQTTSALVKTRVPEQRFLVELDKYVAALMDTVSRLGDICGQLCAKSEAAADYQWHDYNRDVEDYNASIARYKALGGRLNHLYEALKD